MVNLDTGELLPRKKRRRRRKSSETTRSLSLLQPATLAVIASVLLLGGAWWYLMQEAAQQATAQHEEAMGSFEFPANDDDESDDAQASGIRTAALKTDSAMAATPAFFPTYVPLTPTASTAAQSPAPAPDSPKTDKPTARVAKAKPKEPPRPRRTADPEPVTRMAEVTPASVVLEPPAPPRPSPEQACGGLSFLSKAACMQSQCAANSAHPQCRRMRETQEALRRGSGGG
jgi:type IV secretory pathway VirB10-like protein